MKYLLLGAGAAFIGMLPLPIDAYHLIRWIVSGVCAYGAYEVFQNTSKEHSKGVALALIALTYNPLFPFYLTRSLWLFIDVLAGGFLIWITSTTDLTNTSQAETPPKAKPHHSDERLLKIENNADILVKRMLFGGVISLVVYFLISFFLIKP